MRDIRPFAEKGWLLAAFVLLLGGRCLAGEPGDASVTSLKLPVGGRGAALGEAYSGLVSGAEALAWNPAALYRAERRNLALFHAAYVDSSAFDYAAYSQRLSTVSAFGVGVRYFSAGSIAGRNAAGADTGSFTPSDTVFMAGYARQRRGALFGGALKFVQSQLRDSAGTATLDLGYLSRAFGERNAHVAVTASNLGGSITYDGRKERLPRSWRAGLDFELRPGWVGAVDAILPADNGAYAAAGTEYIFARNGRWDLALRAGLNTLAMSDIDGFTGLSLGLGFLFDDVHVDYAFVPMGDLAMTHRLSLSLYFNPRSGPRPRTKAKAKAPVRPAAVMRSAAPMPKPAPAPAPPKLEAAQPLPAEPKPLPSPKPAKPASLVPSVEAEEETPSVGFMPEAPVPRKRRGRER